MKMIEEFNVSGKFGNDPIKGKVTTYTNNIKKAAQNGVKTSIISSWQNIKDKINPKIYNKELIKKVGAALIIGTITMTSLTGCQISPDAKTAVVTQETVRVEYTVKPGESFWKVAAHYSNDVQNEINRICELNNMRVEDNLPIGKVLKLDVPITSKYFANEIEQIEWNAKDYFVYQAFDIPESEVHPDNNHFWVVKEEVSKMLVQAKIAQDSLAELEAFNIQDQIDDKKNSIDNIYDEAIRITENTTGKKFDLKTAIDNYNNYIQLEETKIKNK
ncbi:MAG: LysM peptidoglycan-binding domain-containing protein [Bacilli bacterium]|nr:LysM peptidoglycan-binding domain-containing protein [Bacilli bacterium]